MAEKTRGQDSTQGLRGPVLEYLAVLASEVGLAANTITAYRRDLERAMQCFQLAKIRRWQRLKPGHVADLLAQAREEGAASATQLRLLASLRGLFRYLRSEGQFQGQDPTRLAGEVKTWKRLPNVLAPEEAMALLDAPPESGWKGLRDRALLALLYGGGLRVSEACGLQLDDLSLRLGDPAQPGVLRVRGKGGKERFVPFGGTARDRVEEWLQVGRPLLSGKSPWVLLSKSGKALDRVMGFRIVRHYAAAAGLDAELHPHVLRHSCATHLLAGGGDLRSVQEFLGHADLRTTEIYTHLEVQELQAYHKLYHPRA